MGQLIDDLLKLSRISRSEMHREKVNLSAIAKTIAKELQQRQPDRQVKFVFARDVIVNGDRRLLQVVLGNLIDNAWKFTRKQPNAKIEFGVNQDKDKKPVCLCPLRALKGWAQNSKQFFHLTCLLFWWVYQILLQKVGGRQVNFTKTFENKEFKRKSLKNF